MILSISISILSLIFVWQYVKRRQRTLFRSLIDQNSGLPNIQKIVYSDITSPFEIEEKMRQREWANLMGSIAKWSIEKEKISEEIQ